MSTSPADKAMTIAGYYSTKIGLEQAPGDNGQLFSPVFEGCTHKEHQIDRARAQPRTSPEASRRRNVMNGNTRSGPSLSSAVPV